MQNNESRLIKATRRTIRAEVTLVVVIVIIFSWSVYALYKLTVGGSESLFGLSFTKSSSEQVGLDDAKKPNEEQARERKRLVQELLASQQELYNNLVAQRAAAQQPQARIGRHDDKLNRSPPTKQDVSPSNYNHLASGSSPIRAHPVRLSSETPEPDYSSNIDLADDSASTDERTPSESSEDSTEVNTSSPETNKATQDDVVSEAAPSGDEAAPESEPANEGDQPESENAENTQDQEVTSEDVDKPDDESLKETGHAIDEEVDRMTQPSLGVVYQHDKPALDYQNTIQFDDSPASGSGHVTLGKQTPLTKIASPGDLIARFAPPQSEESTNKKANTKQSKAADLQVDHGTSVSQSIDSKDETQAKTKTNLGRRKKESIVEKGRDQTVIVPVKTDQEPPDSSANHGTKKRKIREKRSAKGFGKIGSAREFDLYLEQLNLDDLLGQSSSFQETLHPLYRNHALAPSKATDEQSTRHSTQDNAKFSRRSDFEDDEAGNEKGKEEGESFQVTQPTERADMSNYHHLTSDDKDLQELIARQKLIDELRTSQLPAPIDLQKTNLDSISNQQAGTEPQSADTLFSIDHGLLLSPGSDEKYSHKSMSKKKKKQAKMKHKKKMTVAMKKGGHKNKKHKKEEKKFLKEKKFKGAKKGKKVAKGKGGQGGKKGKKLYKDKGFKKKGFKNVYHKEEFGQKKSYFDEFRDKDFKKKWKKFDDKYNYAQMKKWQAKDVKGAKKMKDHSDKFKKYDKSKWKKKYEKHSAEHKASSKKHKKSEGFR